MVPDARFAGQVKRLAADSFLQRWQLRRRKNEAGGLSGLVFRECGDW
jgi:hypothetical protein